MTPPYRIGLGHDRHRLEAPPPDGAGRPFLVAGVPLEFHLGPVGHSDADALLHAVTDAILGALAEPDIGQLFPDDDPRHAAADSTVFLDEALRRMRAAGYAIGNLDATILLERPKLAPIKDRVRRSLADKLGVDPAVVNVKGKTGEKVGPVGEGRAIDVHAAILLVHDSVD